MNASLRWGAATDVGRVRGTNEDSLLAKPPIFAVADGMGGHADGDVASALAVAALAALAGRASLTRDDVAAAIAAANTRILEHAHAVGAAEIGTTVTGIAVVAPGGIEHWLVFNVGDSRVYRWSDDLLVQITVDHSEVQELVEAGLVAPAEARSHRLRSVVTRALGTEPAPDVDWWLLPVVAGDRFLICSDGLVGELAEEEIAEALRRDTAHDAAKDLVARALASGGRDNVTAVTVDVETLGEGGRGVDEDTRPRAGAVAGGGVR